MHRRTNPKKMRRRLKEGDCNLSDVGLENLSKRQVRKIAQFAKHLLEEADAPSRKNR